MHVLGDAHVYANHVDPLKEQLTNHPRPFPVSTPARPYETCLKGIASSWQLVHAVHILHNEVRTMVRPI